MYFLWEKVDFHCLVSLPECNVQPDICFAGVFPRKEAFAWAGLCEEQNDETLPLANLQIPTHFQHIVLACWWVSHPAQNYWLLTWLMDTFCFLLLGGRCPFQWTAVWNWLVPLSPGNYHLPLDRHGEGVVWNVYWRKSTIVWMMRRNVSHSSSIANSCNRIAKLGIQTTQLQLCLFFVASKQQSWWTCGDHLIFWVSETGSFWPIWGSWALLVPTVPWSQGWWWRCGDFTLYENSVCALENRPKPTQKIRTCKHVLLPMVIMKQNNPCMIDKVSSVPNPGWFILPNYMRF